MIGSSLIDPFVFLFETGRGNQEVKEVRPYNDTTWFQKSDEPVRNLKCHKMERIEPPKGLCFDSNNLSADWKKWRKHFEFYLTATEKNEKTYTKTSILMSCIGEKGWEIYETFEYPANADENNPEPSMVLNKVLNNFIILL